MKKIVLVLPVVLALGVLMTFAVSPSSKLDFLQLGDSASELSHSISGFGPVEPGAHGGNWGSIATTSDSLSDKNARVVWSGDEADHFEERGVEFTMAVPKKCSIIGCNRQKMRAEKLTLRVLDGIANDDFLVLWENPAGNWELLDIYVSDPSTEENWKTKEIDLREKIPLKYRTVNKKLTFKVVATGNAWDYKSTYGQVALDYVILENF